MDQPLSAAFLDANDRLRIFQALSDAPDLSHLLDVLIEELGARVACDGILVNLLDEERENLVCHRIVLPPEFKNYLNSFLHYKFPLDSHDMNVACYRRRSPVIADHNAIAHSEGATKVRFERWNMRSIGIVPITVSSHTDPVGTVMVFKRAGDVSSQDVAFIGELFGLAANRLKGAKHHADLRQKERMIRAANREQNEFLTFVNRVNNLNSRQAIYRVISQELLRQFPVEMVSVWFGQDDQLVCKGTTAADPEFIPIAEELDRYYAKTTFDNVELESTINEVLVQNSPMYIEDVATVADLPMSDKVRQVLKIMGTPRSILHTPIRYQNKAIGVLTLASCRDIFRPTESDTHFIELLCTFMGSVINNAELYDTVEMLNAKLTGEVNLLGKLAMKDRLTGLYNFGYFQDALEERVHEFRREPEGKPLSIIIFDIDRFAEFNLEHGTQAGNGAIQEVAYRLLKRARKMDIPCRFGGEEFVVILPRCSLANAAAFAEQLRREIEKSSIQTGEGVRSISISAGCATCRADDDEVRFVERANKALFTAKGSGRNRVEVAD